MSVGSGPLSTRDTTSKKTTERLCEDVVLPPLLLPANYFSIGSVLSPVLSYGLSYLILIVTIKGQNYYFTFDRSLKKVD